MNAQRKPNKDATTVANLLSFGPKQTLEWCSDGTANSTENRVSRTKSKQPEPTRRTNSSIDILGSKRSPTPQNKDTDDPKKASSGKKSDLQRLCCSFRRTRRTKTALELDVKTAEFFTPSYGTINSSAMSNVMNPDVARRGISALEKGVTKTLCSQMSRIISVDEDEEDCQGRKPRPNGFHINLDSGERLYRSEKLTVLKLLLFIRLESLET